MRRFGPLAAGPAILPMRACGCDNKPKLPPDVAAAAAAAEQNPAIDKGPTTQEILDAPRKPLRLATYPLSLTVPYYLWKMESWSGSGSSLAVEGPAPSGNVRIQISSFPAMLRPASAVSELENQARLEKSQNTKPWLLIEFRPLGEAKVLEKRSVTHLAPDPADKGDFKGSDVVDWSLMVFVPHAGSPKDKLTYDTYVLTVIGLTVQQYQQDQPFLDQIIASLQYDPTPLKSGL
jgi:hypothetical protein